LPLLEAAIDPFVNIQSYFATAQVLPFVHVNQMALFSVPPATARKFDGKKQARFCMSLGGI
jgi:hypothetical protein